MATTNTEKRRFYNSELSAKGFTKAVFFQTVLAMANGEEVDDNMVALVGSACEYELEGIANRPSKSAGEKKDPLQSDYANALRAAIVPLVDATPRTAKELADAATAKGKMAPSGKAFNTPWISRVLNAEEGIVCVKKIVDKVDAKGLKSQTECNAYKRA